MFSCTWLASASDVVMSALPLRSTTLDENIVDFCKILDFVGIGALRQSRNARGVSPAAVFFHDTLPRRLARPSIFIFHAWHKYLHASRGHPYSGRFLSVR